MKIADYLKKYLKRYYSKTGIVLISLWLLLSGLVFLETASYRGGGFISLGMYFGMAIFIGFFGYYLALPYMWLGWTKYNIYEWSTPVINTDDPRNVYIFFSCRYFKHNYFVFYWICYINLTQTNKTIINYSFNHNTYSKYNALF